ncbi:hypothetical protein Nepgr_028350 [Nepenthes gracilis]|uniref:Uncharacterized protein n=1 Tax=Nepenthes gracilis TaxID=150966 RepID=A0AAD3TDI4_NEPGR|nr:hypothetical protein Nepgr_028350 [Nepenthes gracilis]
MRIDRPGPDKFLNVSLWSLTVHVVRVWTHDEAMPPKEPGHDSVQALSPVYPDYGALDSSAVSRAFAAAFQLESRD